MQGGEHAARKGQNPTCERSDWESNRGISMADEGKATGSATLFRMATTTNQGRRCESRIWRIGWNRRFKDHMAEMVDREATVVRVERVGLLEVEDEVGQVDEERLRTRLPALAENLTFFPLCFGSIDSCASSSPQLATIFPTHLYRQTTSSSRNLHTVVVVLFVNARPSTWFVRSSLTSTKYFIYPTPIGIETRSTIHLKCMVSGYVDRNSSR